MILFQKIALRVYAGLEEFDWEREDIKIDKQRKIEWALSV